MPPALYDPYAVLLRYQVRFNAWFSMLTPEYAWGMLGDTVPVDTGYTPPPFVPPGAGPTPAGAPGSPAACPARRRSRSRTPPHPARRASRPADAAAGRRAPASRPGGRHRSPRRPGSPPGSMPPPSRWERTSAPSADEQRSWGHWSCRARARSWMIFAIVWGSIVFVGQIARDAAGGHRHTTSEQVNTFHAATLGWWPTTSSGWVPTVEIRPLTPE